MSGKTLLWYFVSIFNINQQISHCFQLLLKNSLLLLQSDSKTSPWAINKLKSKVESSQQVQTSTKDKRNSFLMYTVHSNQWRYAVSIGGQNTSSRLTIKLLQVSS